MNKTQLEVIESDLRTSLEFGINEFDYWELADTSLDSLRLLI